MSHAFLYVSPDLSSGLIPQEILKQEVDIEHFIFDSFGINQARELKRRSYLRPVVRSKKDFLVSFSSSTTEAQNALLKLFEDPPPTTIFHVVLPREDILIPTLRSRLIHISTSRSDQPSDAIDDFLKLSYKDRIDEIAKNVKNKDNAWIENLVFGIEKYSIKKRGEGNKKLMEGIVFVRNYLNKRGSSTKMLLEELALLLPVKK